MSRPSVLQVVEAVAATMEQENLTRMEAFEHFLDSKPSIPGKSEPEVAEYLDNMPASTFVRTLAQLVMNEFDVPSRSRLPHVSSIETVVQLIRSAEKILVLTGAGISTSCGIPDFRSATGVYSMLGQYNLQDPQDLFAIGYFKRNVKPFYDFARRLWPGTHKPAPTHRFIQALEQNGCLLRNYTQNIDTLEHVAGIRKVLQCHGSFSTATCTRCKFQCKGEEIQKDIVDGHIPRCPRCKLNPMPSLLVEQTSDLLSSTSPSIANPSAGSASFSALASDDEDGNDNNNGNGSGNGGGNGDSTAVSGMDTANSADAAQASGQERASMPSPVLPVVDPLFDAGVMKPDIVFFGESLPSNFFDSIRQDVRECDLLLVMGTSLNVAPVSKMIEMVGADVPQVLINREVVARPHSFDVELLGNCDQATLALGELLGWDVASGSTAAAAGGVEEEAAATAAAAAPASAQAQTNTVNFVRCPAPHQHRYLFEGHVLHDDDSDDDDDDEEEEEGDGVDHQGDLNSRAANNAAAVASVARKGEDMAVNNNTTNVTPRATCMSIDGDGDDTNDTTH